jgi:hypothetical protein
MRFPKLRFAALVETGTRVLFGARMGPYAKSEQALARDQIALANDIDPERLSFTHSIEVIKRKLPAYTAGFSPSEDAPAPTADNP